MTSEVWFLGSQGGEKYSSTYLYRHAHLQQNRGSGNSRERNPALSHYRKRSFFCPEIPLRPPFASLLPFTPVLWCKKSPSHPQYGITREVLHVSVCHRCNWAESGTIPRPRREFALPKQVSPIAPHSVLVMRHRPRRFVALILSALFVFSSTTLSFISQSLPTLVYFQVFFDSILASFAFTATPS
jgi:hypothetical protein